MDKQIKVRVDEWAAKVETTPEGTFIYIEEEDREEVLKELVRVLDSTSLKQESIPFVIVGSVLTYADGEEKPV